MCTVCGCAEDEIRIESHGYLLGCAPIDAVTWKFLDGSGFDSPQKIKKLLPPLPEKLTLPKVRHKKLE